MLNAGCFIYTVCFNFIIGSTGFTFLISMILDDILDDILFDISLCELTAFTLYFMFSYLK